MKRFFGGRKLTFAVEPPPPPLFLEQSNDVIIYMLQFLPWIDLHRLSLACKKMAMLVKIYIQRSRIDFQFDKSNSDGFELAKDDRLAIRYKNANYWRPLRGLTCFEQGIFHWELKMTLDPNDNNDWRVCVGVAGKIHTKIEPNYGRWHGGNCHAFGIQVGSGGLVTGSIGNHSDHQQVLDLNNNNNNNIIIIGITLDMSTNNCTVAFWIDRVFAGKHCFKKTLLPGGKLWPIISCTRREHQVEVLTRQ